MKHKLRHERQSKFELSFLTTYIINETKQRHGSSKTNNWVNCVGSKTKQTKHMESFDAFIFQLKHELCHYSFPILQLKILNPQF